MKLNDLLKTSTDELEIIDKEVCIDAPLYLYGGHSYENNEEEKGLYLLENWVFNLDICETYNGGATINVFNEIKKNWKRLVKYFKMHEYNYYFLGASDEMDCEEYMADVTNDVFTILSQGYYHLADNLVEALKIK